MRQRVIWATLGFVLVTLAVLWRVAGSGELWRSAKSPGSLERADESGARASPETAPVATEAGTVPERAPPPAARRLRVRVVTPAGPLEGAELRIVAEGVLAVTGADGVGELGTDDLGVAWVRASKEGFREVETAFPGGTDEGEIVVLPGVPLRGLVVRAQGGTPVAGAEVRVAERASGDGLCRVLTTDAEGRFAVPGVASGTPFVVAATFPGFAPAAATGVAGTDITDVRVVLGDGARLEGTVRGGDGKAAADVAIRVFPADDPFLARSFDSSFMGQARLRAAARTRTDDRGSYAVEGIAPGEHVVLALGPEGASARSTFAVAAPGEAVRVDLALEPTGCILVRVLDPDGRPVPGAWLSVRDAAAKWIYGPRVAERTDDRGEGLATGLEPGRYQVVVRPERWTASRAHVLVERGPPAEVEIRVERGVPLEGTVRDPAGRPVAGIDVEFLASEDGRMPAQHRRVVTGRDGRFVLEGLLPSPGSLRMSDWAERWTSWTGDALPGGPSLSIVLRAAASVTGRFDPPPASRRVAYTIVQGESMSGRWELDLDAAGGFVLPGLDEGEALSIFFDVPGGCLIRSEVTPLAPGERRDLGTLAVAKGRALRGLAVDERGEPWIFTRVGLSYDDYGIDRYTLTDESGRFTFEDVDPAALLSVTVWNADSAGQSFELDDWTSEPVHELVVPRPAGN